MGKKLAPKVKTDRHIRLLYNHLENGRTYITAVVKTFHFVNMSDDKIEKAKRKIGYNYCKSLM